jgi:hypothetical protein
MDENADNADETRLAQKRYELLGGVYGGLCLSLLIAGFVGIVEEMPQLTDICLIGMWLLTVVVLREAIVWPHRTYRGWRVFLIALFLTNATLMPLWYFEVPWLPWLRQMLNL